jgi:hypothetical protein
VKRSIFVTVTTRQLGDIGVCAAEQLTMKSQTQYFAEGSIIADSHQLATGLMVITSGFVNVELPMDSEEAEEENRKLDGRTLLYVFGRG